MAVFDDKKKCTFSNFLSKNVVNLIVLISSNLDFFIWNFYLIKKKVFHSKIIYYVYKSLQYMCGGPNHDVVFINTQLICFCSPTPFFSRPVRRQSITLYRTATGFFLLWWCHSSFVGAGTPSCALINFKNIVLSHVINFHVVYSWK